MNDDLKAKLRDMMGEETFHKAKVDSEFGIGPTQDGGLGISIKMTGLPPEVVEYIISKGDELPLPIITAIMQVLGAQPHKEGEKAAFIARVPKRVLNS